MNMLTDPGSVDAQLMRTRLQVSHEVFKKKHCLSSCVQMCTNGLLFYKIQTCCLAILSHYKFCYGMVL